MHACHSVYNGTRQGVELMQVSLNWYNILPIMQSWSGWFGFGQTNFQCLQKITTVMTYRIR